MFNQTKKSSLLLLFCASTLLTFIPEKPAIAGCLQDIVRGNTDSCKPPIKNTPFDPKTWSPADWLKSGAGEACEAHALATAQRNRDMEQGLDPIQKEYLRPYFGDLVDQVTVKWDSLLNDNWSFLGHKIQAGSAGQALGNTIYIADKRQPYSTQQLVLLAHEFVHVQQYQRHGNLDNYCREYMTGYAQADYDYESNSFEREAYGFEYKFARELQDKIPATEFRYIASFPSYIQRSAIVLPIELPAKVPTFKLQTGTALHQTGDNAEFEVLPNGDVVTILKSGTGSNSTEIHILDSSTNYQTFKLQTGTALHRTGDNAEFEVLPNGDIVTILKSGTGSNSTEIHILDSSINYQQI